MKAERGLCRERVPGWLHLHASCDVHRVSTIQSRSFDHVKDLGALVSFTVHEWAHETVPSLHEHRRGIEVQGACSAEAAGYRSYLLELLFLARPIRCEATVSFVGVVQRRQAKQERHRALRRSSWTLRPDAVIHFSASGECVLVSPRLKATVRVHSPSVDGLRPRLRRGRLVALRPQCRARSLSGLLCVVWCQARPTFRASVRDTCGSGVARLSSSAPRGWR